MSETQYDRGGELGYSATNPTSMINAEALLRAEEEVELAQCMEAGLYAAHLLMNNQPGKYNPDELEIVVREGQEAKERFIKANQRLVANYANKLTGTSEGPDFWEAMQDGQMGLIRSIERFDFTKGFKFSTFADKSIRQSIVRGKNSAVYIPYNLRQSLREIMAKKLQFIDEHGYEPTVEDLATPKLKAETVESLLKSTEVTSLNIIVGPFAAKERIDLLEGGISDPEEEVLERIEIEALNGLMERLPEREREILKMRNGWYGKIMSRAEIGLQFDLSPDIVKRLEMKALAELKRQFSDQIVVH